MNENIFQKLIKLTKIYLSLFLTNEIRKHLCFSFVNCPYSHGFLRNLQTSMFLNYFNFTNYLKLM